MKHTWSSLIFVVIFSLAHPVLAVEVQIVVEGVDSDKGLVLVQLCRAEEFKKFVCAHQAKKPARKGEVEFSFPNVEEGQWAATAFHDENSNYKLDTNFIGIPKEGTGFSRNAKGSYGPPKFEQAMENVSGKSHTLRFALVY